MVIDLNKLADVILNAEEPEPINYALVRQTLGVAIGNQTYVDNISEEELIEMIENADVLVHQAAKGFLPQIDVLTNKACRRQIRRVV